MSEPLDLSVYIGADPDLHRTAIAVLFQKSWSITLVTVNAEHKLREAAVRMAPGVRNAIEVIRDYYGPQSLFMAVEGQKILYKGNANFSDIALLSVVAGAALSALPYQPKQTRFPLPEEWKGNVPKPIHHQRIAKELDFEIEIRGTGKEGYGVAVDESLRKQLPLLTDWKHGMDALGLALWARKKHREAP